MNKRQTGLIIGLCLTWLWSLSAAFGVMDVYHINRDMNVVDIDLPDDPSVFYIFTESGRLTEIMRGEPVTLNTNETYVIEKEAISIGYSNTTAQAVWNMVTGGLQQVRQYPEEIREDVGWVKGTQQDGDKWGAYLWLAQNRIAFKSSETNWWKYTNGVPVAISNVLVGTLGDYPPLANIVDLGPTSTAAMSFPGAGYSEDKHYRVDITNVFYSLIIPSIWITPRDACACVGGSNLEFTVVGTNIPNGVTWSLSSTNFDGHAEFYSTTGSNAWVATGDVATNYKIRATSVDNTNFYDEVSFTAAKIEVTNIKFNWDTNSSANDAINIRQDYSNAYNVSAGEWVKGGTNIPVCYTINKSATIKARFTVQPPNIASADIWALAIGTEGSLGDVLVTNVTFSGGVSSPEYVTFQIFDTMPDCIQKTDSDIWQWKAENVNGSDSAAAELNTSGVHTVYTILAEPVSPWDNTAGSQKNAWTKALDFAIGSASCNGDSTVSNAMGHITAYLHGNGFGMTYDTTNGASQYGMWGTGGDFDLTAYMNGSGCVNCYDQAAGVLVCTRLIGGSPSYLFMYPFGYILQANLVGVGQCNNPFFNDYMYTNRIHTALVDGGTSDRIEHERSGFGNHAIIRTDGMIYDATCGPHSGTESLLQYAASSIDITSTNERPASSDGYGWGGDENGVFSTAEVDAAISSGNVANIH